MKYSLEKKIGGVCSAAQAAEELAALAETGKSEKRAEYLDIRPIEIKREELNIRVKADLKENQGRRELVRDLKENNSARITEQFKSAEVRSREIRESQRELVKDIQREKAERTESRETAERIREDIERNNRVWESERVRFRARESIRERKIIGGEKEAERIRGFQYNINILESNREIEKQIRCLAEIAKEIKDHLRKRENQNSIITLDIAGD